MFTTILKSFDLVTKFNHRHDERGRFTSSADSKGGEQVGDKRHVSSSGKTHLTTARVGGKDFLRPQAAVASVSATKRGKKGKAFMRAAEAHGATAAGLEVSQKAGVYKKRDGREAANKAVHIGEVRSPIEYGAGGSVSNDDKRQKGKDILATSAAVNGGNVTQFHSVPKTARKRDRAKHLVLNTKEGQFKTIDDAHKALEEAGLGGVAHVTRNAHTGGHEIHIPIANMATAHGKAVSRKAKLFHLAHQESGMSAEHFNGERITNATAHAESHIANRPSSVQIAHAKVVASKR